MSFDLCGILACGSAPHRVGESEEDTYLPAPSLVTAIDITLLLFIMIERGSMPRRRCDVSVIFITW